MSVTKRALLVDDNDELRSATREYLEELGYAITTASGAEEALETSGAVFDLLVSDVDMPGMSGIELADHWARRQPRLAILLISSRGGEPEVRRRVARGDVAFRAKPFSPEELAAGVSEAMDRASSRSSIAPTQTVSPAKKPPGARDRRARWPKATAQMLGIVALLFGLGMLVRSFELGAPSLPVPVLGEVTRGLTIEVMQPLGPLATGPEELVWQPVDGAESYPVSLSSIDGTVLWRTQVFRPPADLPLAVRRTLNHNVTYYWSVEALNAEGKLVGRSELAPFAIEPTPSNP